MSEENENIVETEVSESIIEIAKKESTEKTFKGEKYITCFCRCGEPIRNQIVIDDAVKCGKCGNSNKA